MSNYFNLGKFAVEKGPKLVRTVVSPIKQAAQKLNQTFKPKKKTKDWWKKKNLKRLKKANRMKKKNLKKKMKKIG